MAEDPIRSDFISNKQEDYHSRTTYNISYLVGFQ